MRDGEVSGEGLMGKMPFECEDVVVETGPIQHEATGAGIDLRCSAGVARHGIQNTIAQPTVQPPSQAMNETPESQDQARHLRFRTCIPFCQHFQLSRYL